MSKKTTILDKESRDNKEGILPETEAKALITMTLEDKVLDYINKHPDGVKILDMEGPLREKRMRLGFVAKKLLDDSRILKTETIYYPKTRHEG